MSADMQNSRKERREQSEKEEDEFFSLKMSIKKMFSQKKV